MQPPSEQTHSLHFQKCHIHSRTGFDFRTFSKCFTQEKNGYSLFAASDKNKQSVNRDTAPSL